MLNSKYQRMAVRYNKLAGTKDEKIAQYQKQLNKFERDAKAGKLINLSDLIGNAESLHQR